MEKIITELFQVIRAAFDIESFDISLSAEEYEKLIAFGKKQSILPVIYAGMKRMDTPVDILKTADYSRNQDLRRYVLYHDALGKICRALDDAGIDYIPLKGSVLCNLYPAPEMRTSSDIDVLVHEEDLERAVRTIESATDFGKYTTSRTTRAGPFAPGKQLT